MKILLHDAYRTFDFTEMVNDIYCEMIEKSIDPQILAEDLKISVGTVYKVFNYCSVSMPTLLLLAQWANLNLMDYIIQQD